VTQWVDRTGAALLAQCTERTIRNWVADGTLVEAVEGSGWFDEDAVLEAKRTKAARVGRPRKMPAQAGGMEQ
jgi:hypothetical protein